MSSARASTAFNADRIPPELRELAQWVCWVPEERGGKWTKVPRNPRTAGAAKSTDSLTWASFDVALAEARRRGAGVGFVFSPFDGLTGIDLDGCRDARTGDIAAWAAAMIRVTNSYTETSPSGTGVKIWLRGTMDVAGRRRGPVEIYSAGRFFTVTGARLDGAPATVEPRQAELDELVGIVFPPEPPSPVRRTSSTRSGVRVTDAKFEALMAGNWQALGYSSQSDADLALCGYLARATGGDEAAIDAAFRQSGLYRAKWERADYRARTIAKALHQKNNG